MRVDGKKSQVQELKRLKTEAEKLRAPNTLPVKDKEQELKKAATQFEGMLVQQLLRSMWTTVPKNDLFKHSTEDDFYQDMLNEAVAQSISEGQGIGIKDVIMKDMRRIDARKK